MPTLRECLGKAGKNLPAETGDIIRGRMQSYGWSEMQAAEDLLDELQIERKDLVGRIREQAGRLPFREKMTDDDIVFKDEFTPAEQEIERRFADKITGTSFDILADEYNALPEAEGGYILNGDVGKELSQDYLDNRARNAAIVHDAASSFVGELVKYRLTEKPPEGETPTVRLMAGGSAAGKTYTVRQFKSETDKPEFVVDGTFSYLPHALETTEAVLDAGRRAEILLISADIGVAFERAMSRAVDQRRTIRINDFVRTHIAAAENIMELYRKYRNDPRVDFGFIINHPDDTAPEVVKAQQVPVYGYDEALADVRQRLESAYENGEIDIELYQGFLSAEDSAAKGFTQAEGISGEQEIDVQRDAAVEGAGVGGQLEPTGPPGEQADAGAQGEVAPQLEQQVEQPVPPSAEETPPVVPQAGIQESVTLPPAETGEVTPLQRPLFYETGSEPGYSSAPRDLTKEEVANLVPHVPEMPLLVLSSAEIPEKWASQVPAGSLMKGYYDTDLNRPVLIHDVLQDDREVEVAYAHEVIGHYGMENIITDWDLLAYHYTQMRKQGSPEFLKIWDEVNRRYIRSTGMKKGKPISLLTETKEFIAVAAEFRHEKGPVARYMDRVKFNLIQGLRDWGNEHGKQWFTDIRMEDINELLRRSQEFTEDRDQANKGVKNSPEARRRRAQLTQQAQRESASFSLDTISTTQEERVTRADKQGWDTATDWFWGSKYMGEATGMDVPWKRSRIGAIFLSSDRPLASQFSGGSSRWLLEELDEHGNHYSGGISPVWIRAEKIFNFQDKKDLAWLENQLPEIVSLHNREDEANTRLPRDVVMDRVSQGNFMWLESQSIQVAIRQAGYQGFYVTEGALEGKDVGWRTINVAIFDPKNIRSKYAEFNPAKRDSPDDLLASLSPSEATEYEQAQEKGLAVDKESRHTRATRMGFNMDDVYYTGSRKAGAIAEEKGFDRKHSKRFGATFFAPISQMAQEFTHLNSLLKDRGRSYSRLGNDAIVASAVLDEMKEGSSPGMFRSVLALKNTFEYDNPEHQQMLADEIYSHQDKYIIGPEEGSFRSLNTVLKDPSRQLTLVGQLGTGDWGVMEHQVIQAAMRNLGFDSFRVLENIDYPPNIGVWDTSLIRSPDAVFDPDYKDSNNLLASLENREHLGAVEKGLPMDKPSRMERANQMLFNIIKPWFMGSKRIGKLDQLRTEHSRLGEGPHEGVFFFSENQDMPQNFMGLGSLALHGTDVIGTGKQKDWSPGGMKVFLATQNTFDYRNPQHMKEIEAKLAESFREIYPHLAESDPEAGRGFARDMIGDMRAGDFEVIETSTAQRAIRELGYDSFYTEEEGLNIGVFNPNQVRSVNAAFDPEFQTSPDLLASLENESAYAPDENSDRNVMDMSAWEWSAPKPGGAQPGAIYADENGDRWLVKEVETDDHTANEVLAAKLYEAAGVAVPQVDMVRGPNGEKWVASKWIDGLKLGTPGQLKRMDAVREGMVVDAWLANWDVVGPLYDNIQISAEGNPLRIDMGGALQYKGIGTPKGNAWGDEVNEIDGFRNPQRNRNGSEVFGNMTDEEIGASIGKVAQVTDEQIDDLVNQYGPQSAYERMQLGERLKTRRDGLMERFGAATPEAPVAEAPQQAPLLASLEDRVTGRTGQQSPRAAPPSPTSFGERETERRFQEAKEGIGDQRGIVERVSDKIEEVWHGFSRRHIDLPNAPEFALANEALRQYEAAPAAAKEEAIRQLKNITEGMSRLDYDIFARKIILDDLAYEDELGHELPFGFTTETLETDREKVDRMVSRSPVVQQSIAYRQQLHEVMKEDLVEAGILTEEQVQNPAYFRHQVLTYARARQMAQGTSDMKKPKPGYAKARKGSLEDINANYLEAEFEYLHRAMIDMKTVETIEKIRVDYDESANLKEQAKQLSQESGEDVDWRDLLPEGYRLWQPDKGNLFYTGLSVPEAALNQLTDGRDIWLEEVGQLEPEAVKEMLASIRKAVMMGGKKFEMAVPEELAATLDNMRPDVDRGLYDTVMATPLKYWKQWTLISPRRVLKYNLNNISGDLDAVIAGNPKVVQQLPAAIKELWQVMRGADPSDRYKEAVERGVFDAGLTVQEIPDINLLDPFQHIIDQPELTKDPLEWTGSKVYKVWSVLRDFTRFRENWLRYASYLDYAERLEAGETIEDIGYGASNPKMVDEIVADDLLDGAGLLARDLVGDYGDVSQFGQGVRKRLIPFYSWMEVNTRRYVRLLENAYTQGIGKGLGATAAVGIGAGARASAYLGIRMLAMYSLVQLWNNLFFGDEEDELSESDRVRLHINLGKDDDGQIRTLRFQGALSDFLQWFGAEDAVSAAMNVEKGRASMGDVAAAVAKGPVNRVASGLSPVVKLPFELAAGQQYWPDIFNPRPIRDRKRHVVRTLGLENEYDWLMKKPSRGYGKSLTQALVYKRDSGEQAYNKIRGIAADWNRKRKGTSGSSTFTSPRSQALYELRQSLRFGDKEAETRARAKMLEMKLTGEDIHRMKQGAHPLGSIALRDRGPFLGQLTPREQQSYQGALNWYREVYYPQAQPTGGSQNDFERLMANP